MVLNLENVQVRDDLPDLSDMVMTEIGKVFNGDVIDNDPKNNTVVKVKSSVRISFVDVLVLIAIILFITSGSVKFMISDTVSNYFILNTLHSIVIAIIFYVYIRITS